MCDQLMWLNDDFVEFRYDQYNFYWLLLVVNIYIIVY